MASSLGQSPDSLASEGHGAVNNSPLLLSGSEDAGSPPKLVSERAIEFSSQIPLKSSDANGVAATSGEAVFNQLLHRVSGSKLNDSAISSCSEEGGGVDGEDQFSVSPVSSVCGSDDDEAAPVKEKEKEKEKVTEREGDREREKEKEKDKDKERVKGYPSINGVPGSKQQPAGRDGVRKTRHTVGSCSLTGVHFEALSKPASYSKLARPRVQNLNPKVCPTGSSAPYRYRRRVLPASISSATPHCAPFQWLPNGETRWSLVPLKWEPGPLRAWTKRQGKSGRVSGIKLLDTSLKENANGVSVVRSHKTITLRGVEYQFCAMTTKAKCRGNMNATDRKIKSLIALMETSSEVLYSQGMEIRRLLRRCTSLEIEQDLAAKLNASSLLSSNEHNVTAREDDVGDSYFDEYTSKRLSPTDVHNGIPGRTLK